MKFRLAALAFLACAVTTSTTFADGVIDGTVGANYGSAVLVQSVQTEFGDNASELNAGYAYCENGRLFMAITGNLEENFNKMSLFFDVDAGVGENVLSDIPDYDFSPDGTNWLTDNLGGMTFDTGFTAQYHMLVRSGGAGNYELDFIDRLGGTSSAIDGNTGSITGTGGVVAPGTLANNAAGSALTDSIFFDFDNSNTAGILGGTGAADPAAAAAVTTGFEFSIALSDLGLDSTVANTIRVAVGVGNGDHNFWSNQFLGGLPAGTGNLGGDNMGTFTGDSSGIDFNDFAGDQFMTINLPAHQVPEPGSLALVGLFGLLAGARRRR